MVKRRVIRLFVAVSALFALLAAAPAYAAQEVFRVTTSGLTASTGIYESDGCNYVSVSITADDGRIKLDGQSELTSIVHGWIDEHDYCTGISRYGFFDVPLDDSAFQMDKKLNQATLLTTIEACGWVNDADACFPVDFDLTWTGDGSTYREKGRAQQSSLHYKAMYSFDGTGRSAIVSGSVVFPWRSFTGERSGSLSTRKSSEMRVYQL